MKLLRLEIENFGKLCGYSLELSDGLNTVCEPNGFGKSTVAAFIKAMLYGLPASTKRNLDKNERKKYTPWQGGSYGGSLEFESDLGRFRIERFFAAKEANDEFRLFDLSNHKPSDAYSSDVGIELFGIDAEGFARSAFLSQNDMDNTDENVTVTAKLTGLLEDVNDMGSYDAAMEILDKRRKFYEVKGGRGKVSDLNQALYDGRRELDRLNALLTEQKTAEASLSLKREEIAAAESDRAQLEEQKRAAELRSAHLSEKKRLTDRLANSEEERKQLLDKFRDKRIPTDAELSDAQQSLKEYRIEQSKLTAVQLTPEESDRLAQFRRRYPTGRPSAQQLSELRASVSAEAELLASIRAAAVREDSPEQKHFQDTGIPPTEELNRLREQLELAQTPASQEPPKKQSRVVKTVCLVAGLVTLIISLFYPLLLLVAGILLIIGGSLFFKDKRISASLTQQNQAREQAQSQLRQALQAYRFLPENGDLRQGLNRLCDAAKRAETATEQQRLQRAQAESLRREVATLRQRLQAQFEACGVAPLPSDRHGALLKLHADLREWDLLTQKAQALQDKERELHTVLARKQEAVSALINRLAVKESNHPETCLAQMESLCRSYAILMGSIRQQQQDFADFESRADGKISEALPSDEELKRRETETEVRLTALRREEADLLRQWNRITEQTQKIPQLEDELAHLSEEQQIAESNLTVLRRTAQLLTESKEALSTRYLGGMQTQFNRFRAMVEGEDAPEALIDTSFSVSVRDGGKSRELESYSRGARDLLQFCARLALTKSMFEAEEKPFLLLDDPFVNLDEAHLCSTRALLDRLSEEFQILYLVCHPDRC
ncbi:MAG: AAA family ATPase [Clostridia bacterium]|nr:AAA family ATPase [Clostridia bacterium]